MRDCGRPCTTRKYVWQHSVAPSVCCARAAVFVRAVRLKTEGRYDHATKQWSSDIANRRTSAVVVRRCARLCTVRTCVRASAALVLCF